MQYQRNQHNQKRCHQFTQKKKLQELNQHNKNKLKSTKTYVNESLYPYYCKLLRKCNSLLKKKEVKSFCAINGISGSDMTLIKTDDKDLLQIFDSEIMSRVESKHNP